MFETWSRQLELLLREGLRSLLGPGGISQDLANKSESRKFLVSLEARACLQGALENT